MNQIFMKKKNLCALALIACMTVFASCSDDKNENNSENGVEIANGSTLKGTLTSNTTLTKGNSYNLSGELIVPEGVTLNIQEGVTITAIYDDIVDYILVKQGGKINAVGTENNPIVMTSQKAVPGAWGGIHICGKAPSNGTGTSEIGNAPYGGTTTNDNSGVLSYVRVEYTGYAFSEEQESNGISFYGVGNGTQVDHCEAYRGSDDGFEFFGGTVNISNMVVVSCTDDSFDWTGGWCGTATNLLAYQESADVVGEDCDCLIEADNNEDNYVATPVSHPVLKNLVLVGNNSSANTRGIRLRRGTEVEIDGAIVCGKSKPITLESNETETALLNGTSTLTNITASAALTSQNGVYTNDNFLAATGNKVDTSLAYASFDAAKSACSWISGSWVK